MARPEARMNDLLTCSQTTLRASTPEDRLKVCVEAQNYCTAIFVPDTMEVIALTESQYLKLIDTATRFDNAINAVVRANETNDPRQIMAAKQAFTEFIASQSGTASNPNARPTNAERPQAPLHSVSTVRPGDFNHVVPLSGKGVAVIPSELLESFRINRRVYGQSMRQAARNAIDFTHSNVVKIDEPDNGKPKIFRASGKGTQKRIDREALVKALKNANFKETWEWVEPTSGNLPVRFWSPGAALLPDHWEKAIDEWITEINDNLSVRLQDREKRKQRLLWLLDPKKDDRGKTVDDSPFFEEDFGRFQSEVAYIWENSEEQEHKKLVEEVADLDWTDFSDYMEESRNTWLRRIENTDLPTYVFDAGAEARFMRYAYGATASADIDLLKGRVLVSAEASAAINLVEGKVDGSIKLPNNKGMEMRLPKSSRGPMIWQDMKVAVTRPGTFDFNRTFPRPHAMEALRELAASWKLADQSAASGARLQIVGHADAPGSDAANLAISRRRAEVVWQLMTFDVNAWLARFVANEWGTREVQIMLNYLGPETGASGLKEDGLDGEKTRDGLRAFQGWYNAAHGGSLKPTGRVNPNSPNGRMTLRMLIAQYMLRGLDKQVVPKDRFMDPPFVGLGEAQPRTQTLNESELNRRVEWRLYEQVEDKTRRSLETFSLGHIRFDLELYLSGFVGANVVAAAHVNFDVSGGKLLTQGTAADTPDPKPKAKPDDPTPRKTRAPGATLSAFAGAQATAGCKGGLLWKCPEPNAGGIGAPEGEDGLSPMSETLKEDFAGRFVELGSVGYSATGSLGVGGELDLAVGIDDQTNKFLIKAKAKAALGLGFGGSLEVAVGARNVFYFMTFVYTQLRDNDFGIVDIFAATEKFTSEEVYDQYCALAYRMLLEFRPVKAGIYYFGAQAVNTLSTGRRLYLEWKDRDEALDKADRVIEGVNNNPQLLKYTAPEVKGRMLHLLCERPWTLADPRNEQAEEAAITILQWVQSQRDYQEVLEHMDIGIPSGRSETEKAAFRARNEDRLLALLDWMDEWEFKDWKDNLPATAEPSSAGPVKPERGKRLTRRGMRRR